jgi:uncharacterized OB-fold protein
VAEADSAEHAGIREAAGRIREKGECAARAARDPANLPMIHNWVQALGDDNPVYTDEQLAARSVHGGLVAPPAMAQVWTMDGERTDEDPLGAMLEVLDEAGYGSIVATNSEQTYHRYLRHGERVQVTSSLEDVVGPKTTALGEGWFVTTRSTWYVGSEPVAEMRFRVLKFRPPQQRAAEDGGKTGERAARGEPIRPAISQDTAYFWDGARAGELRIQRCGQCGLLRHPPGPMCPECGATKPTYLVSEGRGEVYSYTVHHHPPLPGKELPLVVALVELDEGVRVLGELPDVDPGEVHVGMAVEVGFEEVDDDLALPFWKPLTGGRP